MPIHDRVISAIAKRQKYISFSACEPFFRAYASFISIQPALCVLPRQSYIGIQVRGGIQIDQDPRVINIHVKGPLFKTGQ